MTKQKDIINLIKNKEKINSFLIAILCMSGLISFLLKIENIIPCIIIMVFLSIEIINSKETIKRIKTRNIKFPKTYIIYIIFVLIIFIVSIINNGLRKTIIERFMFFIGFLIIPSICFRHDTNIKYIVNSILIISGILTVPLLFANLGNYNGGEKMAISYYMLPTYLAMIMTFFLDDKNSIGKKIIKTILILSVFYPYISFLIMYASRGIIVAMVICIIMCVTVNKKTRTKLIILAVTFLLCIIGVIIFKPTVITFNNVLSKMNIKVEAINKSAKLLENNAFDNGRNKVYTRALEEIKRHPLIGNGIGDYAEKYTTYPHNILLQAWYEGGIVFLFVMIFIIGYGAYIFILDKDMSIDEKYALILFTSLSIIRLMLSYEFWKEISFGLYLYIVFNTMQSNYEKRRKKKDGNCNNSNI